MFDLNRILSVSWAMLLPALLCTLGYAADQPAAPPDTTLSPSFTWGAVPAPKGDAGLSGVYHVLAAVTHLDLSPRTAYNAYLSTHYVVVEHLCWCFFPDGRCYYGMPTEGLDNFSYEYAQKINPLFCCTYRLEGDDGVITWGDKEKSTTAFHRSGKDLLIERKDLGIGVHKDAPSKLLDPCDGLRLGGTFRRFDWQTPHSPKEGMTFTPDGHFTDEGLLKQMEWRYAGYPHEVHDPGLPGRGEYHIASNSLVLLYEDGRKKRLNFHRDLTEGAPLDPVESFVMNTWRYVLVK